MFLNPYILFALTAISIPVLIHLFNLRKVRRQEFSTLMFLKEIQKTKLRRLRLRRLLLLLLRIFIVIFIVLAFADPVFRGYTSGKGENLSKLGIVFIDDSFSMSARDSRGVLFSVAKSGLKQIDEMYSSSDKLYVIRTGSLTAPESGSSRDSLPFAGTLAQSFYSDTLTEASGSSFDVSLALRKAREIISDNVYPVNEVFIISDFRRINFSSSHIRQSDELGIVGHDGITGNDLWQNSAYFYLLNLGHRIPHNISINAVDIKTKLLEPARDIKLSVILKNFNDYAVTGKQINLFVDGQIISEASADLAPYERREIDFSFKPSKSGVLTGYAALVQSNYQDDEIGYDNRFSFSLFVPESYSVGVYSQSDESSKYIKTVLGLSPVYKISLVSSLSGLYNQTDMLFISGKSSFSAGEISSVSDYLKQGRGVFVFPPANADLISYNELFSKFDGFKINEKITILSGTNFPAPSQKNYSSLDFQHPVLAGIFRDKSLTAADFSPEIDAPDIKSIFPSLLGSSSSVLISLKDNIPFLLETKTPGSPLFFCAVSADLQMSDFPKNPLFVPLITKSVAYLGGNSDSGQFSHLNSLLNHDTLESDLSLASVTEISDYFEHSGIKNMQIISDTRAELGRVVAENRIGTPFWLWFIIIAVLLTFIEMYYSRKISN